MIQQHDFVQPEQLNFKDDGIFPNSPLPLLFYYQAITTQAKDPASIFEERFAENDWTNSWRDESIPFLITTARRMKCLASIPAQRLCDSAANAAKTSRCAPAM